MAASFVPAAAAPARPEDRIEYGECAPAGIPHLDTYTIDEQCPITTITYTWSEELGEWEETVTESTLLRTRDMTDAEVIRYSPHYFDGHVFTEWVDLPCSCEDSIIYQTRDHMIRRRVWDGEIRQWVTRESTEVEYQPRPMTPEEEAQCALPEPEATPPTPPVESSAAATIPMWLVGMLSVFGGVGLIALLLCSQRL